MQTLRFQLECVAGKVAKSKNNAAGLRSRMSNVMNNDDIRYRGGVPSIWSNAQVEAMMDVSVSKYLNGNDYASRLLAFVLLVACCPLIAILILLVRVTSKGPGLYRQVRVGKDGRIFVMYKLRSMVIDAEAGSGPVWTQSEGDPRITTLGRFLRKSHLDELPQLVNVVRGEMALFGPRPERPELVHVLADNVPGYLDRLAVKPGITGLAQINLPPDTDLESVRRKLFLDSEYIREASFWLEMRMFLWTGLRLCGVPSSLATRVFALDRRVPGPIKSARSKSRSKSVEPITIDDVLAQRAIASEAIAVKTAEVKPKLNPLRAY